MPLAFIYIQFCAFAQKSKKNEPRKIPSHFHHIPKLQALLCYSTQNIAPYSPKINSPSSNLQTPMLLHRENQPSLWFSAMALSRYNVYLHHPVSLPSPRPSGIRNQSPAGPHFPAGPAGFPGSWLRLAGCDLLAATCPKGRKNPGSRRTVYQPAVVRDLIFSLIV